VSTLGVVIPCYRQERFLPRTLAALATLPAGWSADGVIVPAADSFAAPAISPSWRVLPVAARASEAPLTPGAARMAGFRACGGEWVLFVDADVEMDREWLDSALSRVDSSGNGSRLAGLWGRIEEWFVDDRGERAGGRDLYRLGAGERAMDYLATFALYRRAALLEAGGYDPRLSSEEDFELGLRLRARGWEMRTLDAVAARHWSAPRPSFAELSRRWSTGLCFGQGQVLRLYAGRPGFGVLLRRQAHYLAMLALLALGVCALLAALASEDAAPFLGWLALPAALLALMWARKRSARLAAHALLTWTLGAAGLVVGWFRIRAPAREVAC
jgi:hypothetical protein